MIDNGRAHIARVSCKAVMSGTQFPSESIR